MIDHLKGQYNLTITFDGNSTRGKQSVYTVHVTDPERRVFLLEGDEKSAISHTQERIYEVLKKVINLIGPDRFRAVSSDSTGNTAGARKLLLKEWTWMIELPDCCHRLSLLAKDLCKIPFLHEIIVDMSGVITHFQKSNQATAHLRLLRLAEGTGPGLTSAGKTRFVTQYFAGDALMRNLGHVEKLCLEGTVVLKEKGHLFATEASCGMFRYQLGRLLLVLAPIGKATTCLESSHSTVSDVMVFWLAVMLELHDIVVAKDNGLDTDVKELIRAAANKRWKQMFGTHDVYLTGLVLDPRYRGIDLGVKDLNPLTIAKVRIGGSASASGSQTSKVPELVKRAGNFLMDMAWTEYNVRERVIAGLSQEAVVERLRDQVLRFVKGAYPFDREVFPSDGPQQWWDRLNVDQTPSNPAQPLAWLCSAMFALCPNSIADERTGSTFTWMNSYLRNRLEVPTLVRMTQLRSWVRHKPSEPKPISRPTVKFRDMKASLGAVSTGTKRKRDHDGTANSDANVRDRDNSDSDSVRSDESSSSSDSEESDSDDDELDDAAGSGEFLAQRLVDFSQPTAALRDVLSSTAPPAPPARPVPKAPQPPSTSKPRLLKYSDWKM
ncbi:hypothetical protein PsYK624_004370 [Phanerochaete sordida]|uniref:DUF659 domain-containing protein n=1 Tax=Phanerochaete sordida TaxID=48140 RepID=A0A9P3FXG3_9APHY|nr:hypothetical protein PsYK624_004370 [Phanerochaete sordida]